jgi:hypothetical protein
VIDWIVPQSVPWWLGAAALAAVVALTVWLLRAPSPRAPATPVPVRGRFPALCGLFAGAYLVVILADRLLLDASALLDKRFLLPLHLVAILGVLAWVGVRPIRGFVKTVAIGAVTVLVLLQLGEAATWVRESVDDGGVRGGGYTSRLWRDSPVIAAVGHLPPGVPVYTNGPDAIWFLTGRTTKMLPVERDYLTGRSNPDYGTQIAEMGARMRAASGLVVYFPMIKSRRSLPTVADLRRVMPLRQLSSDPVGAIYEPGSAP